MQNSLSYDLSTPQGRRDELFNSLANQLQKEILLQDVDDPDHMSLYIPTEGEVK